MGGEKIPFKQSPHPLTRGKRLEGVIRLHFSRPQVKVYALTGMHHFGSGKVFVIRISVIATTATAEWLTDSLFNPLTNELQILLGMQDATPGKHLS